MCLKWWDTFKTEIDAVRDEVTCLGCSVRCIPARPFFIPPALNPNACLQIRRCQPSSFAENPSVFFS